MEQFEKYVKETSRNELNKRLKDLTAHAINLGKTIPTLENEDEQAMYLKEFNNAIEQSNIIKEEFRKRDIQKIETPPTKVERLFPTVTKIIQDRKPPIIEEEEPKIEETATKTQETTVTGQHKEEVTEEPKKDFYEEETDVLRATDMLEFFKDKPDLIPAKRPQEEFTEITDETAKEELKEESKEEVKQEEHKEELNKELKMALKKDEDERKIQTLQELGIEDIL